VRDQLDRYRGRQVKTTGDGFLAIFDGAARAVRAAVGIQKRTEELGLEIRIGIHTGEVAIGGDDVEGAAVHEGARIAADAADGEILVSSTTRQLATGAGLDFEHLGQRDFKGIEGSRSVFKVTR
jgi:class 3 adenylate cyclase